MSDLISVIVSTYNWPEALYLVLESLLAQTDPHFEIVIADDGSGEKTKEVILSFQSQSKIPIIHVWQEDLGFRVARARNQAALQSHGSLLFFIDGDCLLENTCLARLRAIAKQGYFVAGNRVLLTQHFTQQVLEKKKPIYRWNLVTWLSARKSCNRLHPFLKLPLGPLRRWVRNRWVGAKGCNLAIWRKDYWAVNGLDESFEGWGYEDSDLVVRLQHLGVRRMTGRFACPVIHLWHPENDRRQELSNWNRFQETLRSDQYRAKQGLAESGSFSTGLVQTLGVIILTFQEEKQIEQCLKSAAWADQILVIDSGSTDQTLKICKQYTSHIIETDWPGFGQQRNRALQHVTTDWVLFLDADERISDDLRFELQSFLRCSLSASGYRILRHSSFMGRVLYYGDWRHDYVLRLFQRGKGRYSDSAVHERCVVEGSIGLIQSPIQHEAVRSLEQALDKMNAYSTLGAEGLQKKSCGVTIAFFHGLWTFIRGFIVRRGFLDGREGFLIALLNAGGSFFKYVKRSYKN